MNLADFYRKEAKKQLLPFQPSNLIQSRKLFIDDTVDDFESDYYDQVAMESIVDETNILENLIADQESGSTLHQTEGNRCQRSYMYMYI